MTLILFFLKAWSIMWTIKLAGMFWAIMYQRPKELNFSFNLKTTFEWVIYATSIYSWFYAG